MIELRERSGDELRLERRNNTLFLHVPYRVRPLAFNAQEAKALGSKLQILAAEIDD